jgi:hypothetical protein
VDEDVVSLIAGDEAEALLAVEKLNGALHGMLFSMRPATSVGPRSI